MKCCLPLLILFSGLMACQFSGNTTSDAKNTSEKDPKIRPDSIWFCVPKQERQEIRWIETNLGKQKAFVTLPGASSNNPELFVFLHGDSPFGNPVYQYIVARKIVSLRENTIAVGLLRPGYRDGCGDQSAGDKGLMMGGNYSGEVLVSVKTVLDSLKHKYQPSKTILFGHSGGAALTALVASKFPDILEESILAACPCDLKAWRASMLQLTENTAWQEPMEGLSPMDFITGLDPNKPVHLFVGDKDVVTPSSLSESYVEAARKHNKAVSYELLPNQEHDLILEPGVLERLLSSISNQ